MRGTWLAGTRAHHGGVIECDGTDESVGSLLKTRYERSSESASLRFATRGPAAPLVSNWGVLRRFGLAAVLKDCADTSSLSSIERAVARNARSVDIGPTD